MTELLYLNDCYIDEFESNITKITDSGIVLKKTCFYPSSGGQIGDSGNFVINDNSYSVKETVIRKGEVVHKIKNFNADEFSINLKVKGKINWEKRYQIMKFHTAQHLVSRYFQLQYGAETVGNQVKTPESRLDFKPMKNLKENEIEKINQDLNAILSKEMEVEIFFLEREEAIQYLMKKEYQVAYINMIPKSVTTIRIVKIDDYDYAACGGTHIKNMSEIKKIQITKRANAGKNKERVYYKVL